MAFQCLLYQVGIEPLERSTEPSHDHYTKPDRPRCGYWFGRRLPAGLVHLRSAGEAQAAASSLCAAGARHGNMAEAGEVPPWRAVIRLSRIGSAAWRTCSRRSSCGTTAWQCRSWLPDVATFFASTGSRWSAEVSEVPGAEMNLFNMDPS